MRFRCARLSGPARRRSPGDCGVWCRTGRFRVHAGHVASGSRRSISSKPTPSESASLTLHDLEHEGASAKGSHAIRMNINAREAEFRRRGLPRLIAPLVLVVAALTRPYRPKVEEHHSPSPPALPLWWAAAVRPLDDDLPARRLAELPLEIRPFAEQPERQRELLELPPLYDAFVAANPD